jgi:hypothetical protein
MADFPDVNDRLAYLNFVHGALAYTLATDLDKWGYHLCFVIDF